MWEPMRCWRGYLSGARCRLFACGPADATAVPKPHHLLCPILIQTGFTSLVPAYAGCPGKEAVKRTGVVVSDVNRFAVRIASTQLRVNSVTPSLSARHQFSCRRCIAPLARNAPRTGAERKLEAGRRKCRRHGTRTPHGRTDNRKT